MKKIIITLLLSILSLVAFSQNLSTYSIDSSSLIPKYLLSGKDTVGIVITMKQAQKIDIDYDLLYLYRSINTDCDSTIATLNQSIIDYRNLDSISNLRFKDYDTLINIKDQQISDLTNQINLKNSQLIIKDSIISEKDNLINLNKNEVNKFKKQRNRAIGILCGISAILLSILAGHI
jgi:hypothetical protein